MPDVRVAICMGTYLAQPRSLPVLKLRARILPAQPSTEEISAARKPHYMGRWQPDCMGGWAWIVWESGSHSVWEGGNALSGRVAILCMRRWQSAQFLEVLVELAPHLLRMAAPL